jgi:hypothetical protein
LNDTTTGPQDVRQKLSCFQEEELEEGLKEGLYQDEEVSISRPHPNE